MSTLRPLPRRRHFADHTLYFLSLSLAPSPSPSVLIIALCACKVPPQSIRSVASVHADEELSLSLLLPVNCLSITALAKANKQSSNIHSGHRLEHLPSSSSVAAATAASKVDGRAPVSSLANNKQVYALSLTHSHPASAVLALSKAAPGSVASATLLNIDTK